MAGSIFINYRREDPIGMAGRLHDRLALAFGRSRLLMDVEPTSPRVESVDPLNAQLAMCGVFLALIGPNWLHAKDANGRRRLEDPDDLTTIEIAAALARGIRVIPVLIDGTSMPTAEELPDSLKALARRNAVEVRNTQFGRDVGALTRKIRDALKTGHEPRLWIFAAAGTVMLLLAGWAGLFEMGVPVWVPFAALPTSTDDTDWGLAKTADIYEAYMTYLNAHPRGRHVVEAHRAEAEVRPIAGALKEEPPIGTLKFGATALVDDLSCKRGDIKVVTGGSREKNILRTRKCVPRGQIP